MSRQEHYRKAGSIKDVPDYVDLARAGEIIKLASHLPFPQHPKKSAPGRLKPNCASSGKRPTGSPELIASINAPGGFGGYVRVTCECGTVFSLNLSHYIRGGGNSFTWTPYTAQK
jgi:hypothetical protein